MGEVKLLRTWSSPFALRIVWALKLKGIEYETIYEDLANKSSLLLKHNPVHKKVPVLLHNGTPICESLVILEYIDETWNDTARLLPDDPIARANARFWAKFNDEQVVPSFFRYFMSQGKDREKARETAMDSLKLVEEHLKGKKFFGGETVGFVDLVFGWLAYYPAVASKTSNLELFNEEQFPNLRTWKEHFCDIRVIKENWPDEESLYRKFQERHLHYGIPSTDVDLVILKRDQVLKPHELTWEIINSMTLSSNLLGLLLCVAPLVFHAYTSQGVEQEEAKAPALRSLDMVEKQLNDKKFFGGETLGFLDLAFGWIANYLGVFEETSAMKLLDEERFPLISAWTEKFSDIPVIKENWPDRAKLVTKFQIMRENYISDAAAK